VHPQQITEVLADSHLEVAMGLRDQAAADQHPRFPEPVLTVWQAHCPATDAVTPELVMVVVDLHDVLVAGFQQMLLDLRPVNHFASDKLDHDIDAVRVPGNLLVIRERPPPTQFLRRPGRGSPHDDCLPDRVAFVLGCLVFALHERAVWLDPEVAELFVPVPTT
jgi:hypothetical protein